MGQQGDVSVVLEAFLVGANQELNYELLWRRLPADMRATAFRRFWGYADGSDDIDAITTWDATTAVGTHVKTTSSMVLIVRSELVRRYPSVLVAAVPAEWKNENRSPVQNPPRMVLPRTSRRAVSNSRAATSTGRQFLQYNRIPSCPSSD